MALNKCLIDSLIDLFTFAIFILTDTFWIQKLSVFICIAQSARKFLTAHRELLAATAFARRYVLEYVQLCHLRDDLFQVVFDTGLWMRLMMPRARWYGDVRVSRPRLQPWFD